MVFLDFLVLKVNICAIMQDKRPEGVYRGAVLSTGLGGGSVPSQIDASGVN